MFQLTLQTKNETAGSQTQKLRMRKSVLPRVECFHLDLTIVHRAHSPRHRRTLETGCRRWMFGEADLIGSEVWVRRGTYLMAFSVLHTERANREPLHMEQFQAPQAQ